MDQDKIGKFILELRKEKNMTQQELADILGITDRAISKWENGRGMPDLSLIKPLCQELGITINELLSGERISKDNYQKKSEENILKTINYTDNKLKKKNVIFKVMIATISIILTLIILFIIDIKRMNDNLPVIFSTWGFSYAPPVDLSSDKIEYSIKNYLVTKGDNETKHYNNEKTFVSMHIYLVDEIKEKNLYYVYAWVLEEKYYLENNIIKQSSGSSIPHKFIVELYNDTYIVKNLQIPGDGSYYVKDMKKIFPYQVRNEMEKVHSDGTIERLSLNIDEQIKLYFHQ